MVWLLLMGLTLGVGVGVGIGVIDRYATPPAQILHQYR
jgi:hypothetical protein